MCAASRTGMETLGDLAREYVALSMFARADVAPCAVVGCGLRRVRWFGFVEAFRVWQLTIADLRARASRGTLGARGHEDDEPLLSSLQASVTRQVAAFRVGQERRNVASLTLPVVATHRAWHLLADVAERHRVARARNGRAPCMVDGCAKNVSIEPPEKIGGRKLRAWKARQLGVEWRYSRDQRPAPWLAGAHRGRGGDQPPGWPAATLCAGAGAPRRRVRDPLWFI